MHTNTAVTSSVLSGGVLKAGKRNVINRMKLNLIWTLVLCGIPACAPAIQGRKKQFVGSSQFEKMKSLAGTWEGASIENPKEKARVEYTIQADGQKLEEKISFLNLENRSVYSDRSGKLGFTHYGPYPLPINLELRIDREDSFTFLIAMGSGIKRNEWRLHEFSISFLDEDHIIERQTIFDQGQPKDIIDVPPKN